MTHSSSPALQVRRLTKDYGGVGVFDLDLQVERGSVFGFLGPNGAGKSTTIKMLLDFVRPDRGSVRVLGLDPRSDGPLLRSALGFLPAELALWRTATPRRALDHLAAVRGGVDPTVLGELCERFGVALDRPMRTLSTGNKQKVGLVQAFMHRPALVVLDEPTTGLDPLVQQEFQALVRETVDDGRTVFLSSHTLSEVERVADRVGVLRSGRLVTEQSVSSLKALAVRRVHAELGDDADVQQFQRLDGVGDVQLVGRSLSATVTGSIDALVKALARSTVQSLSVDEGDLEQVFLTLYRESPGPVDALDLTTLPAGADHRADNAPDLTGAR